MLGQLWSNNTNWWHLLYILSVTIKNSLACANVENNNLLNMAGAAQKCQHSTTDWCRCSCQVWQKLSFWLHSELSVKMFGSKSCYCCHHSRSALRPSPQHLWSGFHLLIFKSNVCLSLSTEWFKLNKWYLSGLTWSRDLTVCPFLAKVITDAWNLNDGL